MKQIDLMIIGAQKAGTTALKNYMGEHPEILSHLQLEYAFFTIDDEYKTGFEKGFDKYLPDYQKNETRKVVAKGAAMHYNEHSLKRLAEHNPECKVVFVIREPVDRTYSAYQMEVFSGWLKRDFKEIIPILENNQKNDELYQSFITKSLYSDQLPVVYKYFKKDQVRLVLYEEFKDDPVAVCKDLFTWLGVDGSFVPDITVKHNVSRKAKSATFSTMLHKLRRNDNLVKKITKAILPYSTFTRIGNSLIEMNKSSNKMEPLDDEVNAHLKKFFEPYNNQLSELSGVDLSRWEKEAMR